MNDYGRIELEGLRYLIHRYFAENHGWHIHGFAQHNKAEDVGAKILTEKIPGYVEDILEARLDHQGFDLSDAVTMVTVLEKMVFDEGIEKLTHSFRLNKIPLDTQMTETEFKEVLRSFGMLFVGNVLPTDPVNDHKRRKNNLIR